MSDQQPEALRLADALATVSYTCDDTVKAAAELRRLHAENQSLAEFVRAVGGIWTEKTKSVLVGEFSLAASINRATDEEQRDTTLLRQALEALESCDGYIEQLELIVYSPDDTGTHYVRAKVRSTIAALRERLGEQA